jgi:hypothetical protein
MSLYVLTPKPGCERYIIHVGRHPRRTLFATVADFTWQPGTHGDNAPDFVYLGLLEEIVDPTVIVAAVAPYAVIPGTLLDQLRADMRAQPVR